MRPMSQKALLKVVAGVAIVTCVGCGRQQGTVTVTSGESTISAITAAFNAWEQLPETCLGQVVPGTAEEAEIVSQHQGWAIAHFRHSNPCTDSLAPMYYGGPPRPLTINQIGPWGEPVVIGVFERTDRGAWQMNQEGGTPFPCPAPGGATPGLDNGSVPPSVLSAWGLKYAADCASVHYPVQPAR